MRGLYRGLVPSLWLVSHGALQFTLYENFKTRLQHTANNYERDRNVATRRSTGTGVKDALLASTASKLVASITTYPVQVARTRMQDRKSDGWKYSGLHRALIHIFRNEGLRGLYRGLSANVLRVTPQAAVTFITYEQILSACAYSPT